MIYGPKNDGTHLVEFRAADDLDYPEHLCRQLIEEVLRLAKVE